MIQASLGVGVNTASCEVVIAKAGKSFAFDTSKAFGGDAILPFSAVQFFLRSGWGQKGFLVTLSYFKKERCNVIYFPPVAVSF